MTPTDTILRFGFRPTGRCEGGSVQFVYKGAGLSPEIRRTDLRVDMFEPVPGEAAFRATVATKNRRLVFETFDIRDVAALTLAYRNWLEAPHIVARDPARSMPIPGGLVALPFQGGSGSWLTIVDGAGVERILNPVGRWGDCYDAHRERWFRSLVGTHLQAPSAAYLQAAGFVRDGDRMRMTSYPLQDRPGATEAERLRPVVFELGRTDAFEGGSIHVVSAHEAFDGPGALSYATRDVRDVLAFVVAVENQVYDSCGPQAIAGERVIDLPGGRNDLRNPFGHPSDERRWNGHATEDGSILLADPAEELGHLYVTWRDRWAADVLACGEALPCNPLSSRPHTAVPPIGSRLRLAGVEPGICCADGGDVQPVAVFETGCDGEAVFMGRRLLMERVDALTAVEQAMAAAGLPTADEPAGGHEMEALDAIREYELRVAPAPAFR